MDLATLRAKYDALAPMLTERSRRRWAAAEARALGHGGIAVVMRATGLSRSTIQRGLRELDAPAEAMPPTRIRRAGGGRKALTATNTRLSPKIAPPNQPVCLTAFVTRDLEQVRLPEAFYAAAAAGTGIAVASAAPGDGGLFVVLVQGAKGAALACQ